LAELLWRIGTPVTALILSLLAIPLAFVNPRAGRANNLIFALLTYMIYNNLLSVSQAWVAQGRISFGIGVWVVHLAMFVLLVVMFVRRQNPLFLGRMRWR
jgi:lipopolysaccharide export system permease protein